MTKPTDETLQEAYRTGREWKHAPDPEYQSAIVRSVLEGIDSPPPSTGGGGEGDYSDFIEQRSVVWSLSEPARVGRYVTGDWWVVGPITVDDILPSYFSSSGRAMHGSMLNPRVGWIGGGGPGAGWAQGFDSSCKDGNVYNPELNVALRLPLRLMPGHSLVSCKSNPEPGKRPQILELEILTVVSEPPPENSFRPPPYGRWDQWWPGATYDGWLPETRRWPEAVLTAVPIAGSDIKDNWVEPKRAVGYPWFHAAPDPAARPTHPAENMPVYGAEMADAGGACALHSMDELWSESYRRQIVIGLTQIGVDFYGVTRCQGFTDDHWLIGGGHASGVIGPILYASEVLLRSNQEETLWAEMMNIRISHPEITFNETHQTYFRPDGTPDWCSQYARSQEGCPQSWEDPDAKDIAYRTSDTARAWWGWATALEALGLRDAMNHEAFFEYQRRYYEEQVVKRGATAKQQTIATIPWTLECWKQLNGK